MPFRDLRSWLYDIAEAIEDIEDFTLGMDFESFKGDPKTVAAVERKIARIGEAAVRLDDKWSSALSRIAVVRYSWNRKLAAASI